MASGWPASARSVPHLESAGPLAYSTTSRKLSRTQPISSIGTFSIWRKMQVWPQKPTHKRLGAEILAELEILVKPHAVREAVVPGAPAFLAALERADREFPVVRRLDGAAFDDAAAGEADEAGLQVRNHLGDVRPQAVGPALPGRGGKERNKVQPQLAFGPGQDDQAGLGLAWPAP